MAQWRWLHDFLGLFYPNLCLACGDNLPPFDEVICLKCQFQLPHTDFHEHAENPFTERFWGRVPIEAAAALYYYTKGGKVQNLIHSLKYKHQARIGYKLGQVFGRQLATAATFTGIDAIVPVPLHPRKQHQRGYNQAAEFGRGLAEVLELPQYEQALARQSFTATQTKKSRAERLANVMEAFQVNRPKQLEGRHILLVDDVMTTGATLEACATKILDLPDTKVSLATIAIATD